MSTAKDYFNLLKQDYSVIAFILSSIGVLLGLWYQHWSVGFVMAIWFTGFDLLGYKWILTRFPIDDQPEPFANPAYRILQHVTLFFIILMWIPDMWQAAVITIILWMTGFCDLMFYILGKFKLAEEYPWLTTWVWIFPMGAIAKYNKTNVTESMLIGNVLIGIAASIGVLLWT